MSILDQPEEPSLLSRLMIFLGAVGLAVVTFAGVVARTVAARWRGILLTHLFFLTVWLAVQAFLYTRDAYTYLREKGPSFGIATRLTSPSTGPGPSSGPSTGSSSNPATGPATKPSGSTADPKASPYRPVTCWRDRSLDGDCFVPQRKPPPARARIYDPPARARIYERPAFPCCRPYNWRSDDI